ncbi:MAG: glycosyltransferase [Flavobacteriales bacterium]
MMNTDSSIVSVIIPAYNAEKYIEETVASVINQSYKNIELIVVNDGSKDNTLKKLETFNDKRLKIITQPNSGVSVARNKGFEMAKGEYICFLDADDVFKPENILAKKIYLDENTHIGLVHSTMSVINSHSEKTGEIMSGKEGFVLDDLLLWNECIIPTPSSTMIRKNVLTEVGLFNENLSNNADQELFFRITAKYRVGKIDNALVLYRKHNANMHNNIDLLEKDSLLAYSLAEKNGLFKSWWFKKKCFAYTYSIIGNSFIKHKKNYKKGIYYLVKSMCTFPPILFFQLSKLLKK